MPVAFVRTVPHALIGTFGPDCIDHYALPFQHSDLAGTLPFSGIVRDGRNDARPWPT